MENNNFNLIIPIVDNSKVFWRNEIAGKAWKKWKSWRDCSEKGYNLELPNKSIDDRGGSSKINKKILQLEICLKVWNIEIYPLKTEN